MRRNRMCCLGVLAALLTLLSGCMLKTVDQMYCLPRRSEEYHNLQAAMDQVMSGLEYCAPLQGENQQTVQMVGPDRGRSVGSSGICQGSGRAPSENFHFC